MDTEKLPNQGYTKDFTTGARRDGDIGRGRPLIPPIALRSLAKRFEVEKLTETTTGEKDSR